MSRSIRLSAVLAAAASLFAIILLHVSRTPHHSPREQAATRSVPRSKALTRPSPVKFPAVVPVEYLPITPDEAITLNAKQASTGDVGAAAASFRLAASSADASRALKCLTEAVYYEAASESADGQRAIAQVVLNRVRNSAFPNTVCGVVYQGSERSTGCQFTFTCDGSLAREPWQRAWLQAQRIAKAALSGSVFKPVGYATHYHADWVVPYWASSLTRATSIGAHIFYRWKGAWGQPLAFKRQYVGAEPAPWPELHQSQLLMAPQLAYSLGLDQLESGRMSSPIQADKGRPTLTPTANRRLNGSALRIDDNRPRLIPSLDVKPRVITDSSATSAR
jgi:spore germination cell wall hydrolase CwlJ-like protein